MKRVQGYSAFVLSVFLLFLGVPAGCATAQENPALPELVRVPQEKIKSQITKQRPAKLTAGVARVEITPSVGTPLAGYSKRHGKPSTGIRDPLYVRALVLSDGTDRVVFISADLLIFPRPLAEAIFKQIAEKYDIPRQAVVLSATHTHSGIGAIAPGFLFEMVFGHYDSSVVEGLKARILWAVHQAVQHQQPVACGTESGNILGLTENRKNPLAAVDPKLGIFLLETDEKQPFALIVNAAAHPTTLGSQNMRMSGDFPGELTRLVEAAYPGAICLFMNGVAGDLRPSGDLGSEPEEKIKRLSEALAEKTVGLVNQTVLKEKGDLTYWGWRMTLPSVRMRLGPVAVPPFIGRMMRPTYTYVNLIALDDIVFVPLQAELTNELGQLLRHKMVLAGVRPFLLGYSNGYLGYAVSQAEYKEGSYESWMTWYGPLFGEMMVEGISALVKPYVDKKGD